MTDSCDCAPDVCIQFDDEEHVYTCIECSKMPMDVDFTTSDGVEMVNHMHDHMQGGESVSTNQLDFMRDRVRAEGGQVWLM